MKTGILILALLFAADEPTKDLVAAAKDAKTKRKGPATKVLTNADVKKSKGKLTLLPAKEGEAAPQPKAPQGLAPLAQQDENYRRRLETDAKLAAAETKVKELAKELEAVESRYYEENDPDRRDKLIRQQFEETRKLLQGATAQLEQLRPTEPKAPSPEPK